MSHRTRSFTLVALIVTLVLFGTSAATLTLFFRPPVGDWVVVDNQNPGDVYSGAHHSAVTAVSTPAAAVGRHRLAINAIQFPLGYDGGRFNLVPNAQQAVFYVCSGAGRTLDGNGDAPGVLCWLKGYGFNAAAPSAPPPPGPTWWPAACAAAASRTPPPSKAAAWRSSSNLPAAMKPPA